MNQIVIKYVGCGEAFDCMNLTKEDLKLLHAQGTINDYTLCGMATAEPEVIKINGLITCPCCIRIINHCKKLQVKGD